MIVNVLFLLAIGGTPAAQAATAVLEPRELSCIAKNATDGKDRRCHVKIPAGAAIKRCVVAEKAAQRCTLDGKARYVAWTVATGGADCRLLKKQTKWNKNVAMKVGKKTKPGAGTCELRVVVE